MVTVGNGSGSENGVYLLESCTTRNYGFITKLTYEANI